MDMRVCLSYAPSVEPSFPLVISLIVAGLRLSLALSLKASSLVSLDEFPERIS